MSTLPDSSTADLVASYLSERHGRTITFRQVFGDQSAADPAAPTLQRLWRMASRRVTAAAELDSRMAALNELDQTIGDLVQLADETREHVTRLSLARPGAEPGS